MMKIALAFGLLVGTCAFAPPDGTVRFTPPAHYREIWKEAEACTGKHGDFDRVEWYVVEGKMFTSSSGSAAIGEWHSPHNILIASEWRTTDWVVRHEMIHDLTRLAHDGGARDVQIWGIQCHSMWGWLATDDPGYKP
jgi:hypothetical protein